MSFSVSDRLYRADTHVKHVSPPGLFSKSAFENPERVVNGFTAAQRRFGEQFDTSTPAAVIQLMMMTFGQSPLGMFNSVVRTRGGFDITMKDEFNVHVSDEELQRVARTSRFSGPNTGAVNDANFVLAAFIKRQQQVTQAPNFEAALAKTLQGVTVQRCLQGMGVFGLSQFVPASYMAGKGAAGVVETNNVGGAVVLEGVKHVYGQRQQSGGGYGYVLFNDKPASAQPPSPAPSARPRDIWSGFYQGNAGNCVTVSAIKAAMARFGQSPQGIYKQVMPTATGFEVTLRDSFRLQLTHDELSQARAASNFQGSDKTLLDDANFLFAVSAKRALLENNDFRANQGFAQAIDTLNDGEHPGEALRRLGLFGYIRESHAGELAKGAIGTLADYGHSVAVIGGRFDLYGEKNTLSASSRMNSTLRALKLV